MSEELKVYSVLDEVYEREIRLLIGSAEDACEYLDRYGWGKKRIAIFSQFSKSSKGLCSRSKLCAIAIWLPEFTGTIVQLSTLTHELMHAYFFIAEFMNLKPVDAGLNHEMICFVTMLQRKFLEQIAAAEQEKKNHDQAN